MGIPVPESKPKKDRTSHSNARKGQTDYHDGENVTHYLGNDDYSGTDLPDLNEIEDNPRLEGKVAEGNELIEDDVEETASEAEKARRNQLNNPDQETFLE